MEARPGDDETLASRPCEAKRLASRPNESVSLAFCFAPEVSILSSKSRSGIKLIFVYWYALLAN